MTSSRSGTRLTSYSNGAFPSGRALLHVHFFLDQRLSRFRAKIALNNA